MFEDISIGNVWVDAGWERFANEMNYIINKLL